MTTNPDRAYDPVGLGTVATAEDVLVVRDPSGGPAALLPKSLSRLRGEPLAAIAAVQRLAMQIQQLQADLDEAVEVARDHEVSWAGIGWSTGLSPEGARQRWGDPDAPHGS